ncbi:hypothetical protein FBEOM_4602 [Fusarium beomiforme]|uniref:Uncharacterized protein n=1 Tax=Fusarium beomiforme TaxID=44412 RepID=A0A9P5DY17_9HYPO|nr:hypothetical protein FBEOM_4602 [Fusarium beomiforme]
MTTAALAIGYFIAFLGASELGATGDGKESPQPSIVSKLQYANGRGKQPLGQGTMDGLAAAQIQVDYEAKFREKGREIKQLEDLVADLRNAISTKDELIGELRRSRDMRRDQQSTTIEDTQITSLKRHKN